MMDTLEYLKKGGRISAAAAIAERILTEGESAVKDYKKITRLEYMREWTAQMRANYREAAAVAARKK